MLAQDLRRELSRRFYVRSRTARSAALRIAYIAYAATLNGWDSRRATPDAGSSLKRRIEQLFDEDWQDAEAGIYPRELIEALPWREYALAAPKLIADLPRTRARIRRRQHDELPEELAARYPGYYARNFHYQTDGYLGHTSAELYDLQVELLFGGTADAMRRRLIPPVVRFARARETLPRELDLSLVCENAEELPFRDSHFDAVTNVFLMHELPPEVRARVLSEMARVVRPGGLVVVADSLQLDDAPELHRELHGFPARFHEPYYPSYIRDDLADRVREAGLEVSDDKLAFLTKVVVSRRPAT